MKIIDILNNLTLNDYKEKKLGYHKDNAVLRRVFFACYNPDIKLWIKKEPQFTPASNPSRDLITAIDLMIANLSSRKLRGREAVNFYKDILESLSKDDGEVLIRIVNRDLRCGVNVRTINKIWPTLIPTYDVMLAQTNSKNITFPCFGQKKYDGMRCIVTRTFDDEIIMRSRNGTRITCLEQLYKDIRFFAERGDTIDGELLCVNIPRHKSNGILNKAIHNTINEFEKESVRYIIWDIVDYTSSIPYSKRYNTLLERYYHYYPEKVNLIDCKTLYCQQDVDNMFMASLESGDEGIVIKNKESFWVPKRSPDIVKYKATKTCDLVVVDWEEGTGKNKGRLGALVCKSSDGLITVKVGSGLSDYHRKKYTKEFIIGKIVEVCYNAIINDSLYLPRFIKIREDKFDANAKSEIN